MTSLVSHGSRLIAEINAVRRASDPRTFVRFAGSVALEARSIMHDRTLVAADRRMAGTRCRFYVRGTTIDLEGEMFSGARELYCRQVYFFEPACVPSSQDVVVDIGANAGLFTLLAAKLARRVVAIDAQRSFVDRNLARAREHGVADRVSVHWGLVGPGRGVFERPSDVLQSPDAIGLTPPILDMTDLLKREGIDRIGLLKLDIEGSEFALLDPAPDWLRRVDRVSMEVHPRFGSGSDLVSLFRDHGFEVRTRDHTGSPLQRFGEDAFFLYAWRR